MFENFKVDLPNFEVSQLPILPRNASIINLANNPKWFNLSNALERSKAQKLIVVPFLVKLSTVCPTLYLAVKQLACFL